MKIKTAIVLAVFGFLCVMPVANADESETKRLVETFMSQMNILTQDCPSILSIKGTKTFDVATESCGDLAGSFNLEKMRVDFTAKNMAGFVGAKPWEISISGAPITFQKGDYKEVIRCKVISRIYVYEVQGIRYGLFIHMLIIEEGNQPFGIQAIAFQIDGYRNS